MHSKFINLGNKLVKVQFSTNSFKIMFGMGLLLASNLGFVFRWDILVIFPTTVIIHAISVFTSLSFQTLWPNWLNFCQSFQKNFDLWPEINQKNKTISKRSCSHSFTSLIQWRWCFSLQYNLELIQAVLQFLSILFFLPENISLYIRMMTIKSKNEELVWVLHSVTSEENGCVVHAHTQRLRT